MAMRNSVAVCLRSRGRGGVLCRESMYFIMYEGICISLFMVNFPVLGKSNNYSNMECVVGRYLEEVLKTAIFFF